MLSYGAYEIFDKISDMRSKPKGASNSSIIYVTQQYIIVLRLAVKANWFLEYASLLNIKDTSLDFAFIQAKEGPIVSPMNFKKST